MVIKCSLTLLPFETTASAAGSICLFRIINRNETNNYRCAVHASSVDFSEENAAVKLLEHAHDVEVDNLTFTFL